MVITYVSKPVPMSFIVGMTSVFSTLTIIGSILTVIIEHRGPLPTVFNPRFSDPSVPNGFNRRPLSTPQTTPPQTGVQSSHNGSITSEPVNTRYYLSGQEPHHVETEESLNANFPNHDLNSGPNETDQPQDNYGGGNSMPDSGLQRQEAVGKTSKKKPIQISPSDWLKVPTEGWAKESRRDMQASRDSNHDRDVELGLGSRAETSEI